MSKQDKKKAERLYEKYLNEMENKVGKTTTYGDQLYKVAKKIFGKKFIGVFPSDKIPKKIKKGCLLIVNVDKSSESGSHWLGVCKDKTKGKILVYDSFGRSIHEILPSIKGKGRNVKSTEYDKEQKIKETNCGARCLAFLKVFDEHGFNYAKYI
jgi:predicted SpoU family rRNA methylase